jgi:hypothetical protein
MNYYSFDNAGNYTGIVSIPTDFTTMKEPPECGFGIKAVFNIANKEWTTVDIEIEGKYYKKDTNELCTKIKLKDLELYNSSYEVFNKIKKEIEDFYYKYRFFDISKKELKDIVVHCFAGEQDISLNNVYYYGYNSFKNAKDSITSEELYQFTDIKTNISIPVPYIVLKNLIQKIAYHRSIAATLQKLHISNIHKIYELVENGEKTINALLDYKYNIDISSKGNNQIITKAENIEI